MWRQSYNIVMRTPIGPRYGTMVVRRDQGQLDGFLNVLMGKNAFQGVMEEGNRCRLTGQLKTLMRTVLYSAVGRITWETVHLVMETGKGTFEVTGTAQPEREESRP